MSVASHLGPAYNGTCMQMNDQAYNELDKVLSKLLVVLARTQLVTAAALEERRQHLEVRPSARRPTPCRSWADAMSGADCRNWPGYHTTPRVRFPSASVWPRFTGPGVSRRRARATVRGHAEQRDVPVADRRQIERLGAVLRLGALPDAWPPRGKNKQHARALCSCCAVFVWHGFEECRPEALV